MKFLILLLFIGSLLENGLSGKVGPKIWSDGLSQDLTKAGKTFDKWLDADSGMEGRIVGGEQAGMKDAPWQVMPCNKYSTMPHSIMLSVSQLRFSHSLEITVAIAALSFVGLY